MDLLFLGTGAGIPSKTRNVSSICLRLLQERKSVWMFDCGEGTQHQLLSQPVKSRQLDKLFVTHLHGDHVFGIPGLLGTRSSQGVQVPLTIYGPPGIQRFVETSMEISQSHLKFPLYFHEIHHPGTLFSDSDFTVEAAVLKHNVLSLGYRITEAPRTGKLDTDRVKRLGVPQGPLYGLLKQGRDVKLADGTLVRAKQVLSPPLPGRAVVILGDTRPTHEAVTLAAKATVLVHEATFGVDSAALAPKYGHSTAGDAAHIAAQAAVGTLVLTHISQRYTEDTSQDLLEQAQLVFPSTVLAHDGFTVEIPTPHSS